MIHNSNYHFFKRCFDIVFSIFAIITLSPLFAVVAMFLKFYQGKVLFTHSRIGLNGIPIKILKFQTMHINAEHHLEQILDKNPKFKDEWEKNYKLSNDPRLTKLGKILHETKIDETPQFFNVLLGDMSLVGPRPITQKEFEKYFTNNSDVTNYQSIRPGLTGLWQIHQTENSNYQQRINIELQYIKNINLRSDLIIIIRTFSIVIKKLTNFFR